MADPSLSNWDRFQALLERLQPGDEVHVSAVAAETGLSHDMCEHVLEALVRVELFTRLGDHAFLRRRLFEALEQVERHG